MARIVSAGEPSASTNVRAADLPATLITLHLKDAPLGDAMGKLLTTGHDSVANPEFFQSEYGQRKVTVDFDHTPYWEALRQLCERTRMWPNANESDIKFYPYEQEWASFPHAVAGPFMVQAVKASIDAYGQFGAKPDFHAPVCSLELNILAERRIAAIRIHDVVVHEAFDEAGRRIPLWVNPGGFAPIYPKFQERWCRVTITLQPNPAARAIGRVKGEIGIVSITTSKMVELDGIAGGGPIECGDNRVGPINCTITAMLDHRRCTVDANFSDPRGDADAWGMAWRDIYTSQPTVIDATGQPLKFAGMNGYNGGPFAVKTSHRFIWESDGRPKSLPQQPLKMTWKIPAETRIINLPFDFGNLPLPGGT